ncbi:MAG: gliding motility-associated C-terminal domain-containing protein [Bacteroidota bacterium]
MNKSLLRNTILGSLFYLLACQNLLATHIIGGEMNYRCLGNKEFEVSLTVYRDCFLGEAQLDDTAYVAIFNDVGQLVRTLPILLGKIDTITQIDECLLIPPNICVETTTYRDTVRLPIISGGYHVAYQRCCRNGTILNILDPLNTGVTYDIQITEEAMRTCNSSPILNDWPPTFVCVNRPIQLSNVAQDAENDSLVYRLCTPLDGGISIDNPRPRPAAPPPYDTIIWNKLTYSLENILGGTPLKIDPRTGTLTGTPNVVGQYVVGICIEEYRNGRLLSTTRRDFQYNVIPCEDVTAQFELPTSQCENLSINPMNQTEGEPNGFLWKFLDDEGQLLSTSNERNPSYTFADTGRYTVRLIANPTSICADSTDRSIFIQPNTLVADFQYDVVSCKDSLVLQFTDNSTNEFGTIDRWTWTINGSIDQFIAIEQNPSITIFNTQPLEVTLEIGTDNGCQATKTIDFTAKIIPDSFSVSAFDTLIVCLGDSVELNPIFNPDLVYRWSPPDGLSDINAPNPSAFPAVSTPYLVTITDSSQNCELRKNVFLEVIDFDTSFDFTIDVLSCGDSLTLQLTPKVDYDYSNKSLEWRVTNSGQELFFTNNSPIFSIFNSEAVVVSATVSDDFGCSKTVEKTVQIGLVEADIPKTLTVCRGDSIELNPTFNPEYTYQWTPIGLLNDASSPNPKVAPNNTTIFNVAINNQAGTCPVQRQTEVTVLNAIADADFSFRVNSCQDSLVLEITEVSTNPVGIIKEIAWDLNGELEQFTSQERSPTFVLNNSQFVQLSMTINPNDNCPFESTKSFRINFLEDINLLDSTTICAGQSVALNPLEAFPNYVYNWLPSMGLDQNNSINPTASPDQTTTYTLAYSDSTGLCQIEKKTMVVVLDTLPKLAVGRTVNCDGRTVQFSPNVATDLLVNFGDGTEQIYTADTASFTYEYATSDTYEVQFSTVDGKICPDSVSFKIELPEKNLVANADWSVAACTDNIANLELLDLSTNEFGTISNWQWTLSSGATSDEPSPLFNLQSDTTLQATLIITLDENAQCRDSFSLEIPALTINETFTDSILVCIGTNVELNPEFTATTEYLWSPTTAFDNPTLANPNVTVNEAATYRVQVTNAYNCQIVDSIFTNTAPPIEILAEEIPVVCDTQEVVLFAESPQMEQQTWLDETGDTLGLEPELLVLIDRPQGFKTIITDAFGCQNESSLFVDFQPVQIDYTDEQSFCQGEDKVLTVNNLVTNSDLTFEWTPADKVTINATTGQPNIDIETNTTFSFTATNFAGCSTEGMIQAGVIPLPDAAISAEPDTIFQGESSQLEVTNQAGHTYDWMPNDNLTNAASPNPIANPGTTTNYTVLVTDEEGCQSAAGITVTVREGFCDFPYIFVPSGFTPNGDGRNDVLYVRGVFIETLRFIIYDRWGDKVFETTNQDVGWDGTRNGRPLSSGVFGYYLETVCRNGETYSKQGNVTLVR